MIQTIKVLEKSNFHLYIKDFLFKQAIKNIRSTASEVQPSSKCSFLVAEVLYMIVPCLNLGTNI